MLLLGFAGGGATSKGLNNKELGFNEKNHELCGLKHVRNLKPAFSIAEAMITLLIVSVALAASAPLISRQMKINMVRNLAPAVASDIPVGAVMFFDLESCPEHWQPLTEKYPAAQNAFIRNISGTTKELGAFEQNAAPNITAWFNMDRTPMISGNGAVWLSRTRWQGVWAGTSGEYVFNNEWHFSAQRSSAVYGRDEATEIRPDNVALLACRKFE